jgi:acetoin:2,6-dichlorophenolindophenol oxidoreductase subunit beta
MTERKLTTQKAIAEAISQEMAVDESVFVMGEDVGVYGGIFGATEGLLNSTARSGSSTPPSRRPGSSAPRSGRPSTGLRPIVELMFVDFFGVCMDQIYNNMAKIHYFSGGNIKVPMVLTTAVGGGYSDAGQHSQTLWGTFAHLPGMKVVVPSNPYDAKGLMIAAIRDDNPVVYMFHKGVLGLGWMTNNPRATGVVPEEVLRGADRQGGHGPGGHRPVDRDGRPVGAQGARRRRAARLGRASRPRSSTCGRWSRSTVRRSSPACRRPTGCWWSTRTTRASA